MSRNIQPCAGAALRLGLYHCPSCGCEVQIFSDETSVPCTSCGRTLERAKLVPCVEWCASATSCPGKYPPAQTIRAGRKERR
jgi:hypothetical protein